VSAPDDDAAAATPKATAKKATAAKKATGATKATAKATAKKTAAKKATSEPKATAKKAAPAKKAPEATKATPAKKAADATKATPAKKAAAKKSAPQPAPEPDETAAAATTEVTEVEESSEKATLSEEEALRQLEVLRSAVAALDDDTLRRAVGDLSEHNRGELADHLQLPRATMHLGNALAPVLRRKLRAAPPQRLLQGSFTLTEPVNDDTVQALGDRHEDPSRDDMLQVLPGVLERHGTPLVTTLFAAYGASTALCQAVCAALLEDDERLALGKPIEDHAPAAVTAGHEAPAVDESELEAKREERRAAKAARKEAAKHERAAQQAAHQARRAAQRKAKHK
jgi:hypothetical protein